MFSFTEICRKCLFLTSLLARLCNYQRLLETTLVAYILFLHCFPSRTCSYISLTSRIKVSLTLSQHLWVLCLSKVNWLFGRQSMFFYLCFCVTSLVKTVKSCIGHKNCIMKIGALLIMRLKVLIRMVFEMCKMTFEEM